MEIIHSRFFCVLIALSTAASKIPLIVEHPTSVQVTEGMWAYFSCAIKHPGNIRWRVGDYTRGNDTYHMADNLHELEGVTVESLTPQKVGKVLTETVKVLATAEVDRTPIQCMCDPFQTTSKDSYSKFALLSVDTVPTVSSGSGECP